MASLTTALSLIVTPLLAMSVLASSGNAQASTYRNICINAPQAHSAQCKELATARAQLEDAAAQFTGEFWNQPEYQCLEYTVVTNTDQSIMRTSPQCSKWRAALARQNRAVALIRAADVSVPVTATHDAPESGAPIQLAAAEGALPTGSIVTATRHRFDGLWHGRVVSQEEEMCSTYGTIQLAVSESEVTGLVRASEPCTILSGQIDPDGAATFFGRCDTTDAVFEGRFEESEATGSYFAGTEGCMGEFIVHKAFD